MGAKGLVVHALLALAALCLAAVIGFLPASAAASPTPTNDLGRLCAQAAGLTRDGKPADALALIEKIRGQVRSPALAATTACEDERLAAVLKAQQPTPPGPQQNFAERAGAAWDQFVKSWLTPLANAGLGLLGLVAAFLVVGRLLVLLPRIAGVRKRPSDRALLALAGLAFILFGCSLIVLAPVWNSGQAAQIFVQMAGGVLLALVGSLVLATYLSSRLRISLDVRDTKGETSKVDVSQIGALLHELGADAPRGLEIPAGADVTALAEDAMPLSFTNKVLAAVQKVLVSTFGVTPWRVVVSSSNEDSMTVSMARNGASVGAVTIDRNELHLADGQSEISGPDGKAATPTKTNSAAELELHKMAAAYILVMLARKHYGFDGLCGATDWRSLGLHYIATTDTTMADERQKKLLGAAVDRDAGNMLAEVTLQHKLCRGSTDEETTKTYAEWLSGMATRIRSDIQRGAISAVGYRPLQYRLEGTFLSMVLNLPAAEPKYARLRRRARQVAASMVQELEPAKRLLVPGLMAHKMRLEAALAYHDLYGAGIGLAPEDLAVAGAASEAEARAKAEIAAGAKAWATISSSEQGKSAPIFVDLYNEALASVAPTTAYQAACSMARNQGEAAVVEVMRRLGYAFTDRDLKAWARSDPELAELRKSEDFLHFLGVMPRQDFWKLEAFEPYEKQLRGAGIAKPGDLYQQETGQSDVSAYLQVSPLVLKRLCKLAALVRRAEDVPGSGDAWHIYPFRVEVVGSLVQAGVEAPEDIEDGWINDSDAGSGGPGDPSGFVKGLRDSIRERILLEPDAGQLKEWLRQLKKTPAKQRVS
ncbi:hypothetical protein LFT45_05825 [Arthrobacter sp. FW305-BF8]|uniref:hypothetical protein n=1 Tax=Arthrobacter sp. FW305-BF8 TaxID=2879617 RepID=UPI001F223AC5|nr:hypothetical protein [Arthrobacter sp. FW305-BF8]UKA55440.1 hypothetical protein LFT45_05825 [Arthrobacter sp. FW305-BF8]